MASSYAAALDSLGLLVPRTHCIPHGAACTRAHIVHLDQRSPTLACAANDCGTTASRRVFDVAALATAIAAQLTVLCNDTPAFLALPKAEPSWALLADAGLAARASACTGLERAEDELRALMRTQLALIDASPGNFEALRLGAISALDADLARAETADEQAAAEALCRERSAQIDDAEARQVASLEADLSALDSLTGRATADLGAIRIIAAAAQPAELVALAPALLDRAHALFAACAAFQASIAFDAAAVIGGRRGGDAVTALIEAARLGGLVRLKALSLAGLGLSGAHLRGISDALSQASTPWLASLSLDDNPGLGEEGGVALAALVAGLPVLTTLYARDGAFGPVGVTALAAALSRTHGLETLGLSGMFMGEEGAAALGGLLGAGSLPALRTLMLGRHSLPSSPAALLSRLPETLEALHLAGSILGPTGGEAMAMSPLLRQPLPAAAAPPLRCLDLDGCALRQEGGVALCTALARAACAPILAVLILSRNALGERGTEALARALPSLRALERLDVAGNCIDADRAAALARALGAPAAPCPRLASLDLSCNMLGAAGVEALVAVLVGARENFGALERLALKANGCSDAGRRALRALMRGLPGLKSVDELAP